MIKLHTWRGSFIIGRLVQGVLFANQFGGEAKIPRTNLVTATSTPAGQSVITISEIEHRLAG